jgi:NhaA family Na+:H+ antiporter
MSDDLAGLPREPVDRLSQPFARFLRIEAAASVLLLLCVMVALTASNSHWSAQYAGFWDTPIGIRSGEIEFSRSIKRWIGDAAMTLFFFVVALELKREMVLGELRTLRVAGFRWRRHWAGCWCRP